MALDHAEPADETMPDATVLDATIPDEMMPSGSLTDSTAPLWAQHLHKLDGIDLKAILCIRFSPVRTIPKRCLAGICDIIDATLDGIASRDEQQAQRWSRLWLLLPRLLLRAVFSKRTSIAPRQTDIRRMIKERLRAFHNGDWLQLFEEATAKRPATGAGNLDDHEADDNDYDESELNRSAREAVRVTRLNERSRAMSRLTSSGIAPPSKQVAEMLRIEITGGAVLSSSPPGIGFDWRSANLPRCTLDHVALRRRLREAKRGSSPSLSG